MHLGLFRLMNSWLPLLINGWERLLISFAISLILHWTRLWIISTLSILCPKRDARFLWMKFLWFIFLWYYEVINCFCLSNACNLKWSKWGYLIRLVHSGLFLRRAFTYYKSLSWSLIERNRLLSYTILRSNMITRLQLICRSNLFIIRSYRRIRFLHRILIAIVTVVHILLIILDGW